MRRLGKSYAHPLIVLIALPREEKGGTRIGVAAGRTVGNAVQRNRAKRLIRAALQKRLERIDPGWDVVILARRPITEATFEDTLQAVDRLLARAQLVQGIDEDRRSSGTKPQKAG